MYIIMIRDPCAAYQPNVINTIVTSDVYRSVPFDQGIISDIDNSDKDTDRPLSGVML